MSTLGPLSAVHCAPRGARRGPTVVLLHGIGLGAWLWERDQQVLAELGLESWALDLPGHGPQAGQDVRLETCYRQVGRALDELDGPIALVGHSMGGVVAQVISAERELAGLALVASVPCAEVAHLPTPTGLRLALPMVPGFLLGRNLHMSDRAYLETGLARLAPDEQRAALARLGPWPSGIVRDIVRRRPAVPRGSVACPVLVTHGFLDRVASLYGSRLLADHYDAVMWRFDDIGHMPQVEPAGARHARALGEWLLAPTRPRVREVDAFRPDEGVGEHERRARHPNPVRSDSRFGDRWR